MIYATTSGSFKKTTSFLEFLQSNDMFDCFDMYGRDGVDALSRATPKDTGLASRSWDYKIIHTGDRHILSWGNNDVEGGVNVAIILQYGHGTGTGGYVEGIDYINPALRPIFDKILVDVWRQVTNG